MVRYSIYLTDHLGIRKCVDDALCDEALLEYPEDLPYATLTLVLCGVYIDQSLIGDLVERVEVRFDFGSGERIERFFIDGIDYIDADRIRLYCKSLGAVVLDRYRVINGLIDSDKASDIVANVLDGVDYKFLMDDFTIASKIEVSNSSPLDILRRLLEVVGGQMFWRDGEVVLSDRLRIPKDANVVADITEMNDILSIQTSVQSNGAKVGSVVINCDEEENGEIIESVEIKERLTLWIDKSPQPVSPINPKIFTFNGNSIEFTPISARFRLYATPLTLLDDLQTNLVGTRKDVLVIEEYIVEEEEILEVIAAIKDLVSVKLYNDDGSSEELTVDTILHNVIKFNEKIRGTIRVSYITEAIEGFIRPSDRPKHFMIHARSSTQELKYLHRWEYDGYYPLGVYNIDAISDLGFAFEKATDRVFSLEFYDVEDSLWISIGEVSSDETGMISIDFNEYGFYRLDGDIIIEFLANSMRYYRGEIDPSSLMC